MTRLQNDAHHLRQSIDLEKKILYMFHHVFLPPQLPQKDDLAASSDAALVEMVWNCLEEFRSLHGNSCAVQSVASMVRNFRTVHAEGGHISDVRLEEVLAELSKDETQSVALHVSAQNAGVLIRRDQHGAIFEVFELSPDNKSVVSTKGRLQRSFPACAVFVPLDALSDPGFQTTLSQTVSKMSAERIDEMQPKVKKAGERQSETRDTALPHLVTEHLVSFLRAIGKLVGTTIITKNTREEVMWKDAKRPWRRSPLWLLLRVAMQLTFSRLSAVTSKSLYKPFMIFLMSRILKEALAQSQSFLESDSIYAMNAKLSQRLLKIEGHKEEAWFNNIWNTMKMAQSRINSRWDSVMADSCPSVDLLALRTINPSEDLIHELPFLDQFLNQLQILSTSKNRSIFKPWGRFPSFEPDHLPCFADMALDFLHCSFGLVALETWVELHLDTWLYRHINVESSCVALKRLIQCYYEEAKVAYQGNPEALSVMVLTVMDLWVGCDKVACRLYESLKLYDHEIASNLLWSLLLPLESQLSRISRVESYLQLRASQVNKIFVSPFRDFGHQTSFAVRYFDQSPQHQQLLDEIEKKAHEEKCRKVEELDQQNQLYQELMDRYQRSLCENVQVTLYDINGSAFEETQHSPYCKKCVDLRKAKSMTILLHEWPVSRVSTIAKATIFELTVPPDFGAWRDITHYILQTVLGYRYKAERKTESDYTLPRDPGIRSHYKANTERVGIRSQTKPSTLTHRNPISIPTTQESVCLANGLSYQHYDFKTGMLIDSFAATNDLHTQCMFVLPTRSSALQRYLQRTPDEPNGPEPNEVIARLSECPDEMSLDEFRSFATLPLGYEIQWQGMLGQLAIPSLDFTKVETTYLLLQISQQIGPSNECSSRASHEILRDENFAASLLEQLRVAMRRVGENWESFHAITAFICLAARLLASTPFPNIQQGCLNYLASCRHLLFGWVTKLRAKVESCTDDDQRTDFAARTGELALICMSTFSVDHENLKSIFFLTSDASVFLQCSITIQEHLSSIELSRLSSASIWLARWRRLMYNAYPKLLRLIVDERNSSLNLAVKAFWADYKPGLAWQQLPAPSQHWLQSSTASDGDSDSFSVHFNLLTAELLVNGAPLAKLPAQYEIHAMYPILFGRSHIQVMPSSHPAFQFSSRCEYADHMVHFGMLGDDILVHAIKDNCTYDLIPQKLLSGYFPQAFVQNFVHWFDRQLQAVFFAPIKDPWSRNTHYWRLSRSGSGWILTKGNDTLVNMHRRTGLLIAGILSPLEGSLFLHISYHADSERLDVELPRLRLGFYFKTGEGLILSRQFQYMFIDCNQNVGTLFGLTSKLVLKSNEGSRQLLIPEGPVTYQRRSGHVSVSVEQGVSKVHSYCIDTQLGRTVGSGSMQSLLFLCYLHSLTSYCLPDPLTRLTGTEQALEILTSAAVRSFQLLDRDNLATLELIAQLSPKRLFYPQHLQDMQTVHWDPEISFLSQHGQLFLKVQDIFRAAMRSKPLYPDFIDPPSLEWTRLHLLERDLIRSSTIRVSGFGAEKYTDKHDVCHQQRDCGQLSDRAQRAFVVARSVLLKESVLYNRSLTHLNGHLWRELCQQEPIPGPRTSLTQSETLYGGHLLGETAQYLARIWCQAHVYLSSGHCNNKYHIIIWLSTAAFAQKADMLLIDTFVAFYCIPKMKQVLAPCNRIFSVKEGSEVKDLPGLITYKPIEVCPEARLPALPQERAAKTKTRRKTAYHMKQEGARNSFFRMLKSQWPCRSPTRPSGEDVDIYIKADLSMGTIAERWEVWWDNLQFRNYLSDIEGELSTQRCQVLDISSSDVKHSKIPATIQKRHVRNQDFFNLRPPEVPICFVDNLAWLVQRSPEQGQPSVRVESLLEVLEGRVSAGYERQYLSDLQESIAHLNRDSQSPVLALPRGEYIARLLRYHRKQCRQQVQDLFDGLAKAGNRGFEVAASILCAPRTSPRFYLQRLSRTHWKLLSNDWKIYLLGYAKALRALQRADRLIQASTKPIQLISELVNIGDQNWDPMIFPEWLLLEVESGLIIRDVQASIARHMLSPESKRNSVMQLNMGEGKSTVVVPGIAATLADGQNLVRVFVARPQSKQMFQMLVSKLGGLLGCRIYHMPVSRSLRLGVPAAESLWSMLTECMDSGGILLVQPEHVLSFKLMAIESVLNSDELLGQSLLKIQHFFDTESRDIIDESDENFSVKFELIYTIGMAQPIDLSPDRWVLIHHILGLVARFAPKVALAMGTEAIEVEDQRGRFPRTRILQPEAGTSLRMIIAEHICEAGLVGFAVTHQSAAMRKAILRYITQHILTPEEVAKIEDSNSTVWNNSSKGVLLLLRGLLAGGVLEFVLRSKRWRVNYGVDPLRLPATKITVPFRAKDSPSPRSEFSHPDVVILLTSLSYYYAGLSDKDLFDSFQNLLRADQADVEYQIWTKAAPDLPEKYRHISSINLKDQVQCVKEIFPALRFSKGAIDYFLSHLVFQKYIREFPHKMSASGWDLGQEKSKPTTGFSGTVDSRHLLPLDVHHLDLERQKHTNALVLKYILQPENSVQLFPSKSTSSKNVSRVSNSDMLLQTIKAMHPPVRVILDVGAQILEFNNQQVVEKWLNLLEDRQDVEAAIFFNENDEISVIDREGQVELFQVSSFANRVDVCLVFLDEAHTRGTDLRLPTDYRAAVTLGPQLIKDRLVQACMRMRKLGKGQSLVFCISDEIKNKILQLKGTTDMFSINVLDVLSWSISETFLDLRRSIPLWAMQGRRFLRQRNIWDAARKEDCIVLSHAMSEQFLENESQSLEDRYRPRTTQGELFNVAEKNELVTRILERCHEFNISSSETADLEEEQERELSPEIEEEREVEKPAPSQARRHLLHKDLISLVNTGKMVEHSQALLPAFQTLKNTTAAEWLDTSQFSGDLLVTVDFSRTVNLVGEKDVSDNFLRPVQWILTYTDNGPGMHIVVISPFEAQRLLPAIKKYKKVTLHNYLPRPSLQFRTLDALDLFTEGASFEPTAIPQHLITQLNLFAGQLYFSKFLEYTATCDFLGLAWKTYTHTVEVASDGFIGKGNSSNFTKSPVQFLHVLMTKIRRNCSSIEKTHLGRVLSGTLLEEIEFATLDDDGGQMRNEY